jgi:hypothetical protein
VSEWPGGPATDCERWLRWGNDDLKDSMRSSFGFCALVLGSGQMGAGTRAADDARTSQHAGVAGGLGQREGAYRLRNMATALEGRNGRTAGAHRELGEAGTLGERLSRGCYETEQASQRVKPAFKPQGFSTRPERPRAYSDMGHKRRVASETSSGVDGLGRAQTLQFCDGLRRRRSAAAWTSWTRRAPPGPHTPYKPY